MSPWDKQRLQTGLGPASLMPWREPLRTTRWEGGKFRTSRPTIQSFQAVHFHSFIPFLKKPHPLYSSHIPMRPPMRVPFLYHEEPLQIWKSESIAASTTFNLEVLSSWLRSLGIFPYCTGAGSPVGLPKDCKRRPACTSKSYEYPAWSKPKTLSISFNNSKSAHFSQESRSLARHLVPRGNLWPFFRLDTGRSRMGQRKAARLRDRLVCCVVGTHPDHLPHLPILL